MTSLAELKLKKTRCEEQITKSRHFIESLERWIESEELDLEARQARLERQQGALSVRQTDLDRAQSRLREVEAAIAAEKIPPEPDVDLIRWSKRFSFSGTRYDYAALKAGGHWYVTRSAMSYTWEELVKRISKGSADPVVVFSGNNRPFLTIEPGTPTDPFK